MRMLIMSLSFVVPIFAIAADDIAPPSIAGLESANADIKRNLAALEKVAGDAAAAVMAAEKEYNDASKKFSNSPTVNRMFRACLRISFNKQIASSLKHHRCSIFNKESRN